MLIGVRSESLQLSKPLEISSNTFGVLESNWKSTQKIDPGKSPWLLQPTCIENLRTGELAATQPSWTKKCKKQILELLLKQVIFVQRIHWALFFIAINWAKVKLCCAKASKKTKKQLFASNWSETERKKVEKKITFCCWISSQMPICVCLVRNIWCENRKRKEVCSHCSLLCSSGLKLNGLISFQHVGSVI